MKQNRFQFLAGLALLILAGAQIPAMELQEIKNHTPETIQWSQLPPLPDREGFAGMFAGVVSGRLVVAGGANFPDGYPWEGGKKCWYNTIYVLESKVASAWKELKLKLPKPLAYGVSYSAQGKLICAGGETGPERAPRSRQESSNIADVFAIEFSDGEFRIQNLPSLPHPVKDACGGAIGDTLFHFGGIETAISAVASNQLFVMDLQSASPRWQKADPLPAEGRIQALAATRPDSFCLFSGIAIASDTTGNPARKMPYLTDCWEYIPASDPARGRWRRLQEIPLERAAAPGPAWGFAQDKTAIIGGADSARHRLPQKGHTGWSHDLLIYDFKSNSWETRKNAIPPQNARVTAPTVEWNEDFLIISGEIAPGRRSPTILKLHLGK